MINEENLNKLYKDVLNSVELTTKELNSFGFNSKDLNDLIEQGSIIRVKKGLYALKSVDKLFYYGKQLIAQKEYDKATQCFQKCFEIDPTHKRVCFQLFLRCIQNKDYEKAFEYFDIFYNSENELYNVDNNFYLYLLSMITPLPENRRLYAKFLKLEDIKIANKDKRYNDVYKQNKIRISAINQRFTLAAKQLNEAIREKGKLSAQDILIKTLLTQAIEVQIQNRNNIIDLIKQKKYEDIIEFYEKMESCHLLSIYDNYTFILANDLLDIIRTGTIPKKQVFSTENVFEAIDGKNFELAFNLEEEKNLKDKDTIFLMLNEIVNKCRELNDDVREEPITISETVTFTDIIKFLMNGDLDNSFRTLRSYLTSLNKSDYEFLIVDLIKISLLEKDIAFTKPITVLTLISRENYSFDISTYIQEFYINLSQNKFEEARIYLDIISKSDRLGQRCVITNCLSQVLKSSENMLNYKRKNEVLNTFDEVLENSKKNQTLSISK